MTEPLVSNDPALYDPTSYSTLTDQTLSNTGAGGLPGLPGTGSITDVVGNVGGLGGITRLLQVISSLIPSIETGIADALKNADIGGIFSGLGTLAHGAEEWVFPQGLNPADWRIDPTNPTPAQVNTAAYSIWQWLTTHTVGALYSEMLSAGLGVDTSKFGPEELKGVQTVDQLLGFSFVLPFVFNAVDAIGKAVLANRWHDMSEMLGHLTEEMGLSWAMGLQIDEAFKVAVGRSIEEGINRQKRGERIGWPQLRTLLKQHVFADLSIDQYGNVSGSVPKTTTLPGEGVLRGLLENQGFPDQQIDMLLALSDQLLPVGDLQQLYLRGEMTLEEVTAYVTKLGFNDQDRDRLVNLYVSKAETEASTTLRTTARTLFENNLIGESQYRDILTEAHFPKLEIDADVQAVQLIKDNGRTQATISTIKARLIHQQILPEEAITELRRLNLASDYITELIQLWQAAPLPRPHGLTQSQVLRYMMAGFLKPPDAFNRLVELGVNETDANFLVAHPSASAGTRPHSLTPSLVTQAYIDGAINQQDLADTFTKVGVTPDALDTYVAQALYKKAHHRGSSTYTATLSRGDIVAAYKYGVFTYHTAQLRLTELGYSGDDADIILEIENKGPFHGLDSITFSTVDEALAYLGSQGWTWLPPPNPQLVAAERMAEIAGYTPVPPIPSPLPPAQPPA